MIGTRIIRGALSGPVALGAAISIMLISQTARASDGPIPTTTAGVESAHQTSERESITALVSDHLYQSLLAHKPIGCSDPALDAAMTVNLKLPGAGAGSIPSSAPGGSPRLFGAPEVERALQPSALGDLPILTGLGDTDAGSPGQRPRKAALAPGTAPMTTQGKFKYFLRKSFVPPWPYALSILGGVVSQAIDTKDKKHRENAGEFMTGSMEHAARSFAFRTTANFFEKFAYASLFKQDPRYHPSENKGFGGRLGYAISRVFVTQGDQGGSQFNASFILGGLTTAGISNAWEQDKHVNVQDTFKRWGTHVGLTALTNVLHELFRR